MADSNNAKHDYFYDFQMNVPAEESCPYCNGQLYEHYNHYPIPADYIICPNC